MCLSVCVYILIFHSVYTISTQKVFLTIYMHISFLMFELSESIRNIIYISSRSLFFNSFIIEGGDGV